MATATLDKPTTKPERYEPRLLLTHPRSLMRRLSTEMDRLFEEFGIRPFFPLLPREDFEAVWTPDLEVIEKPGEMIVRVDLPGLTRDQVKVSVTDEVLKIEGERKREVKESDETYFRSEVAYGKFVRTLALPEGAMADKISASFKNGVLELVIPVPPKPEKAPRIVEVK